MNEQQDIPQGQTPTAGNADLRDMTSITYTIYGIYALSMLAQFNIYTVLPGSVAVFCALGYAYFKRKELKGTFFESHYQWLIRTFWIGGAVYLPIATVGLAAYQAYMMDMTNMFEALHEGEQDIQALIARLYEDNSEMIFRSSAAVLGVFAVWWWWRCLRGVLLLRKGRTFAKVTSWF